jgi:predicted HTH domain antitoxin
MHWQIPKGKRKAANKMSLVLEIPDEVAQAIRLPAGDRRESLMIELALALYARGILSFGKARELTPLNRIEFGLLLGRRGIPRHYTEDDLADDIAYAHGE